MKNKINGVFIFMSLFIVVLCGLLIYNQITIHKLVTSNSKDNKSTKVTTDKKDSKNDSKKDHIEKLDITSELAGRYYNYIKMDDNIQDLFFTIDYDQHIITTKEVKKEDLSSSIKNYIGYRSLPQSMIKIDSCSNYPNINNNGKFYCGMIDNSQDFNPNVTRSIDENNLKNYVENIFGSNTYQSAEFFYSSVNNYTYDATSKHYVYRTVMGGGVGLILKSNLVEATKSEQALTITENVSCTNAESELCPMNQFSQNLIHTFEKSNDGNYYYSYTKKA